MPKHSRDSLLSPGMFCSFNDAVVVDGYVKFALPDPMLNWMTGARF